MSASAQYLDEFLTMANVDLAAAAAGTPNRTILPGKAVHDRCW
jgi:hypothetical protein